MDSIQSPQRILKLRGISLADFKPIEDLADARILEKLDKNVIEVSYDKIPNSFKTLKNWPTSTKLKCIVCDRQFLEVPKFYPTTISTDSNTGDIEIGVLGFMCSFACVTRYINTCIHKKEDRWQGMSRLTMLYKIFMGYENNSILAAPNKTEREEYGGTLDMENFIIELKKVDTTIENNSVILKRMNETIKQNEETVDDTKWDLAEKNKMDEIIDT
jgi:hypothetical protein